MKRRPRKGEIVSHPRFGTGRVLGNWGTFFAVPDDPKSATDCGELPT